MWSRSGFRSRLVEMNFFGFLRPDAVMESLVARGDDGISMSSVVAKNHRGFPVSSSKIRI
jgi:hypothetical protein